MSYSSEVMQRARRRYETAVDDYHRRQEAQRAALYQKIPEVAQIDSQMRKNIASAALSAFQKGSDPTSAVREAQKNNQQLQHRRDMLLQKNGVLSDNEAPYLCPLCADTGWIGTQMCSCLQKYCKEEQQQELTSLLQPDARFEDFRLDLYPSAPVSPETGMSPREQMEMVFAIARRYAEKFSPSSGENLLMSGATGLGKTFLSACIAREVVDAGFSVTYDTAIHLFSCLEKQKFGGASEEEEKAAARIQSCDLLIFDDLGTEMQTAFITPALYMVVNSRILSHKPTIISTNLTIDGLEKRYSPQIVSRIAGEYTILSFAGTDIRRQKTGQ